MIAGKRYNGSKVDAWSSWGFFLQLLCGYLPFKDTNTAIIYQKIPFGEFKCGKLISHEARDLLKGILNIDPDERLSISQICNHPRTQISRAKPLAKINKKIDETIIPQFNTYGLETETTQKSLQLHKHNHTTATYYLLTKKLSLNLK